MTLRTLPIKKHKEELGVNADGSVFPNSPVLNEMRVQEYLRRRVPGAGRY
jgi:hypothetical protein